MNKKVNISKIFFLSIYILLIIVSILMLLGFQNIVHEVLPHWNTIYKITNITILIILILIIFLMISNRLKLAPLILTLFLFVWSFYTLLTFYTSLFEPIGGVIFRNSFNILIIIILSYRLYLLKEMFELDIGE